MTANQKLALRNVGLAVAAAAVMAVQSWLRTDTTGVVNPLIVGVLTGLLSSLGDLIARERA